MKIRFLLPVLVFWTGPAFAETSLTIYNDNFAIVRETMTLNLKAGANEIRRGGIADYSEPSSVILRDLTGKNAFSVLQQSFHGAALTQDGMLNALTGQTIDFRHREDGKTEIVQGKIIRGGRGKIGGGDNRFIAPIIEVDGKRQFELPGTPLFLTKANGVEIEPEFTWKISAPKAGEVPAEIAYATYAINWFADYNVIAEEDQDTLQITGWITLENKTGIDFENARAKFVAGNVGKLSPRIGATIPYTEVYGETERVIVTGSNIPGPPAKEVEAYYAYNSPSPISIRNGANMQLEFLRAEKIPSQRVYLYAGANDQSRPYYGGGANLDPDKGVDSFSTISLAREFKNSAANHLGQPLPQGRMRFYRRAADQQLEFVGEMDIPATPKDERVQAILGNAFDLIAERVRSEFRVDPDEHSARESFQIKLRNHKSEPVEIRVREQLFRWSNWEITAKSDPFVQKDATTIEFNVPVKAGEEKIVSYTVLYTKLPRGEAGR